MKTFQKVATSNDARVELHDALGLTGAEVSINVLPVGSGVPFVHAHKQNEEIYGILEGKGYAVIDDERVDLKEGDWMRVSPEARRQLFAADDQQIKYLCIQAKAGSLEGFTVDDAVIL